VKNPWLEIALAEYEGHMSLPAIGQARMLGDVFESLLREFLPQSVAVIGCAGGNGFERVAGDVTTRVVGVDINPTYIDAARARFSGRLQGLELHAADIESDGVLFEPVDLIYAALVLEYVNLPATLGRLAFLLKPGAILATVVQLDRPGAEAVTPSKFRRMRLLAPFLRAITPEELRAIAEGTGLAAISSRRVDSCSGKGFQVQLFRRARSN
jgi:SAM-dependent methyltransferase